jgi:hypothetical protein
MVACRILLDGSASEAAIRAETQERSTQFGVCGEGGSATPVLWLGELESIVSDT